jgi:hypothetical protein
MLAVRIPLKGPKEGPSKFAEEHGDGDASSSDSELEPFEVSAKKVHFKKKVVKIRRKTSLLDKVTEATKKNDDDGDFVAPNETSSSLSMSGSFVVDEDEVRELLDGQGEKEHSSSDEEEGPTTKPKNPDNDEEDEHSKEDIDNGNYGDLVIVENDEVPAEEVIGIDDVDISIM